jgi:hypothetical protein
MGTRTDPDAQIPGVEPSRSLDDERLGDKALHLASDQVGVRIRDVERELDPSSCSWPEGSTSSSSSAA